MQTRGYNSFWFKCGAEKRAHKSRMCFLHLALCLMRNGRNSEKHFHFYYYSFWVAFVSATDPAKHACQGVATRQMQANNESTHALMHWLSWMRSHLKCSQAAMITIIYAVLNYLNRIPNASCIFPIEQFFILKMKAQFSFSLVGAQFRILLAEGNQ